MQDPVYSCALLSLQLSFMNYLLFGSILWKKHKEWNMWKAHVEQIPYKFFSFHGGHQA